VVLTEVTPGYDCLLYANSSLSIRLVHPHPQKMETRGKKRARASTEVVVPPRPIVAPIVVARAMPDPQSPAFAFTPSPPSLLFSRELSDCDLELLGSSGERVALVPAHASTLWRVKDIDTGIAGIGTLIIEKDTGERGRVTTRLSVYAVGWLLQHLYMQPGPACDARSRYLATAGLEAMLGAAEELSLPSHAPILGSIARCVVPELTEMVRLMTEGPPVPLLTRKNRRFFVWRCLTLICRHGREWLTPKMLDYVSLGSFGIHPALGYSEACALTKIFLAKVLPLKALSLVYGWLHTHPSAAVEEATKILELIDDASKGCYSEPYDVSPLLMTSSVHLLRHLVARLAAGHLRPPVFAPIRHACMRSGELGPKSGPPVMVGPGADRVAHVVAAQNGDGGVVAVRYDGGAWTSVFSGSAPVDAGEVRRVLASLGAPETTER
jgi:hypothetical protein